MGIQDGEGSACSESLQSSWTLKCGAHTKKGGSRKFKWMVSMRRDRVKIQGGGAVSELGKGTESMSLVATDGKKGRFM